MRLSHPRLSGILGDPASRKVPMGRWYSEITQVSYLHLYLPEALAWTAP